MPLIKRYQKYQRHMIWAGWSICILSLIAGSFATQISTLFSRREFSMALGS